MYLLIDLFEHGCVGVRFPLTGCEVYFVGFNGTNSLQKFK